MEVIYKYQKILDNEKIDWFGLSQNPNPNSIHFLEKNIDKLYHYKGPSYKNVWQGLSSNPNAIHILEKNANKIDWYQFSKNPNAVTILKLNIKIIFWNSLCENPNPDITCLIENYRDRKIDFISIDVEGNNHAVVFSTDWSLAPDCKLLCIEHENNHQAIVDHLEQYGFRFYEFTWCNILLERA